MVYKHIKYHQILYMRTAFKVLFLVAVSDVWGVWEPEKVLSLPRDVCACARGVCRHTHVYA